MTVESGQAEFLRAPCGVSEGAFKNTRERVSDDRCTNREPGPVMSVGVVYE